MGGDAVNIGLAHVCRLIIILTALPIIFQAGIMIYCNDNDNDNDNSFLNSARVDKALTREVRAPEAGGEG